MKVCICSEYFAPDMGSTGKVLYELAAQLAETHPDLQLEVVSSDRQYRSAHDAKQEELEGVSVSRLRTLKLNRDVPAQRLFGDLLFSLSVFFYFLFRKKPDVILVVTNPFVLPLAPWLLKRFFKVPYLYLIHDLYPDIALVVGVTSENSAMTKIFRRLQRQWLNAADRVIVLGRCMQDVIMRNYNVADDRIAVITNWADHETIQPLTKNTKDTPFRVKHGLCGFMALYSGNLGLFHDFDTMLDAAKRLKQVKPEITVVIVGEGRAKEYIAHRIETEALCNVRLLPLVPEGELVELLSSADVSVVTLSSGAEGLAVPLKFYNILAVARPVIAVMSPSSEISRVLAEHECGIQVDQGDVENFIGAVTSLAAVQERTATMGQNARRALEQEFTLAHVVAKYHDLLKEITASR
ncbi:MAG: glycosyltransferase family 4 protein [Deinococcota bacterium]|jgi:glycosyltransferase involved in cell wall biosynthesis|nr:glycosyltransferase family 4 protein [Deinococcota bacterium]